MQFPCYCVFAIAEAAVHLTVHEERVGFFLPYTGNALKPAAPGSLWPISISGRWWDQSDRETNPRKLEFLQLLRSLMFFCFNLELLYELSFRLKKWPWTNCLTFLDTISFKNSSLRCFSVFLSLFIKIQLINASNSGTYKSDCNVNEFINWSILFLFCMRNMLPKQKYSITLVIE